MIYDIRESVFIFIKDYSIRRHLQFHQKRIDESICEHVLEIINNNNNKNCWLQLQIENYFFLLQFIGLSWQAKSVPTIKDWNVTL